MARTGLANLREPLERGVEPGVNIYGFHSQPSGNGMYVDSTVASSLKLLNDLSAKFAARHPAPVGHSGTAQFLQPGANVSIFRGEKFALNGVYSVLKGLQGVFQARPLLFQFHEFFKRGDALAAG